MVSFLCFPTVVRLRVYHAAGLVRNENIYLDRDARDRIRALDRTPAALPDFSILMSLLLTCRTIRAEVSHQLYSTNSFFVGTLRPLRQLSPTALGSLRFLKIHLHTVLDESHLQDKEGPYINECGVSLIAGEDIDHVLRYNRRRDVIDVDGLLNQRRVQEHIEHEGIASGSTPLNQSCAKDKALLADWAAVAEGIGLSLKPHSLNLCFICDVADADTARLAVAPLTCFPILSGAEIRLGHKPNSELTAIAEEAGLKATGQQMRPQSSFFRFMDLPWELRRKTLEYSDLVAPLNKVLWDNLRGYTIPRPFINMLIDGSHSCKPPYDTCHPYAHKNCSWAGDCQICPHVRNSKGKKQCYYCQHFACRLRRCTDTSDLCQARATGCFCARHHASFSPRCQCWRPPISLFLVSRGFNMLARHVFFSVNDFGVFCVSDLLKRKQLPGNELSFFQIVPRPSVHCLRSLDISISLEDAGQWKALLRDMGSELRLRQLSIKTELEDGLPSWPAWPWDEPAPSPTFGEPRGIDIVRETVDLFWPTETLVPDSNIEMFFLEMGCDEDAFLWYYFRHKQQPIPPATFEIEYMDPTKDAHCMREVTRQADGKNISDSGGQHDSNWVEGIFASPPLDWENRDDAWRYCAGY